MDEHRTTQGGPLYWLGERSWRFWVAAGLLPLLYVASLGPFVWMSSRDYLPRWACEGAQFVYLPLDWIWRNGPEPVGTAIVRHESLWISSAYVNPPRPQNLIVALVLLIFAFAAFCVWLTVRIVNRRERWAKWTAIVTGLPVLYVLGIGPVAWFARDSGPGEWRCETYRAAYYPLFRLSEFDYDYTVPETVNGGGPFYNAIDRYLALWGAGRPPEWIDT